MDTTVKLKELVDALSFQTDEMFQYLNTKTGEIVMVAREELSAAEEGDDLENYPEWQQDTIKIAQQIIDAEVGEYIELPTQFEIDEYRTMEKFCLSIADPVISDEMYYAIKGRGAFRRFKDEIHRHGIAEQWYEYRDEALREIAKGWCEMHNIHICLNV